MAKQKDIYEYASDWKRDHDSKVYKVVVTVIIVFLLITIVNSFILYPVMVKSSSMGENVSEGSCVFITPLINAPKRGDVVLVQNGNSKLLKRKEKIISQVLSFVTARKLFPYINRNKMAETSDMRRVIGMPGDTIYMRDYVLYIKPADQTHFLTEFELIQKPYDLQIFSIPVMWDTSLGAIGSFDEIKLKAGEYFLLADDRVESTDSRLWGPSTSDRIKGKALICYFPFNRIKLY